MSFGASTTRELLQEWVEKGTLSHYLYVDYLAPNVLEVYVDGREITLFIMEKLSKLLKTPSVRAVSCMKDDEFILGEDEFHYHIVRVENPTIPPHLLP